MLEMMIGQSRKTPAIFGSTKGYHDSAKYDVPNNEITVQNSSPHSPHLPACLHWSSQTWQDYWLDAISVCLARGRGRIGSEVARTDMFHRQAIHSVPGSEGVAP